jgi:hypothetical protein
VSGGGPESFLKRLQGQREWKNAIRKAERSGDLKEIAALIRSRAYMGFSADLLARLFDDHRLVRKKRGNWKSIFEPSAQEKYADAAEWVRRIEEGKSWAARGMRAKMVYREWAKDRTSFKLIEDYYHDIDDPVAYVAQKRGLNAEKLQSFMQGRFGFGRGRKPKPKPDGPASK